MRTPSTPRRGRIRTTVPAAIRTAITHKRLLPRPQPQVCFTACWAEVAESVDAADSKSAALKSVWVRVPPSAPLQNQQLSDEIRTGPSARFCVSETPGIPWGYLTPTKKPGIGRALCCGRIMRHVAGPRPPAAFGALDPFGLPQRRTRRHRRLRSSTPMDQQSRGRRSSGERRSTPREGFAVRAISPTTG